MTRIDQLVYESYGLTDPLFPAQRFRISFAVERPTGVSRLRM